MWRSSLGTSPRATACRRRTPRRPERPRSTQRSEGAWLQLLPLPWHGAGRCLLRASAGNDARGLCARSDQGGRGAAAACRQGRQNLWPLPAPRRQSALSAAAHPTDPLLPRGRWRARSGCSSWAGPSRTHRVRTKWSLRSWRRSPASQRLESGTLPLLKHRPMGPAGGSRGWPAPALPRAQPRSVEAYHSPLSSPRLAPKIRTAPLATIRHAGAAQHVAAGGAAVRERTRARSIRPRGARGRRDRRGLPARLKTSAWSPLGHRAMSLRWPPAARLSLRPR